MTAFARRHTPFGRSAHQSPRGRLHGDFETQAIPWGASRAHYGWVKEPIELSYARCLELLSSFEVGRVALCTDTGPLVWLVNYSMVEDAIVFRTSPHSLLGTMAWNSRLAFEVDRIDLDREAGWSVLATGPGEMVEDPDELGLIRAFRDPHPWAGGAIRLLYVRLRWVGLTGRELG
jgi:uncharacterized protein